MKNCPVCRSVIIGQPTSCEDCGTPLKRQHNESIQWGNYFALFLPGISHLWNGWLIRGVLALFGSSTAILWLYLHINNLELLNPYSLGKVIIWVIFWLFWSFFWHRNVLSLTSHRASAGRIISIIVGLLFVANALMFFIQLNLLFR